MDDNNIEILSARKKQILFSAIDNYIKLASPITSLLVQQTEMKDLSTATLRNELNALEAMGYLKQLHTSSGRIPTTKGYRFFVNEIVKNTKYSKLELDTVKQDMFSRTNNLGEIVKSIADAVTSKTNYPAVVVLNGFENLIVMSINIMHLLSGQVLVLIDTNAGVITNTLPANDKITRQDCESASKIFCDIFKGHNIGYLMQNIDEFSEKIQNAMRSYEEIFKLVLMVLNNYAEDNSSDVSSGGIIKLLDSPEYNDIKKAKNILSVLDDKEQLKGIFDSSEKEGVSVSIGEENKVAELKDCAVIQTPLIIDGNKIATVGVIGPERLDYASVASVLKFISDKLKERGSDYFDKKEET